MSLFKAVLLLHITLGVMAMIAGPISMFSRKRRGVHTVAGEFYHWLMLGTCAASALLSFLDWQRIWWFLPIGIGSYAFALLGYVSAKRRWKGWISAHIAGQGGSYIALVTAVFVVNWRTFFGIHGIHSPWAWALPTLIGTPLISYATAQAKRRRSKSVAADA